MPRCRFRSLRCARAAGAKGSLAGVTLAFALFTAAAPAQAEKAFQLVGFTSSTFNGAAGLLLMSRSCSIQYPASRMCSTTEVAQTAVFPDVGLPPSTFAWVRSDKVSASLGSVSGSLIIDAVQATSCRGWSTDEATSDGLAVGGEGSFVERDCSSTIPVACCALIAVPEPPQSMLEPAAGAALASIFASRALVCSNMP